VEENAFEHKGKCRQQIIDNYAEKIYLDSQMANVNEGQMLSQL
jgi:hypothetical protein